MIRISFFIIFLFFLAPNNLLAQGDSIATHYHKLLAEADGLYRNKKFEQAYKKYQEAIQINAFEDYPKEKVKEIDTVLKKYKDLIELGDAYFNANEFVKSKEVYEEANQLYPHDYPLAMLNLINKEMKLVPEMAGEWTVTQVRKSEPLNKLQKQATFQVSIDSTGMIKRRISGTNQYKSQGNIQQKGQGKYRIKWQYDYYTYSVDSVSKDYISMTHIMLFDEPDGEEELPYPRGEQEKSMTETFIFRREK